MPGNQPRLGLFGLDLSDRLHLAKRLSGASASYRLVFNRLGRGVSTQFALLGQDCRINPLLVPRYQDGRNRVMVRLAVVAPP